MNFLHQFYGWMIESGKQEEMPDGEKLPVSSLGKVTAKNYLRIVKKALTWLGYVEKGLVVSGKDWRKLTVNELKAYLNEHFPPGERLSNNAKSHRYNIAMGLRKFGQWMVHGSSHWSIEKYGNLEKVTRFRRPVSEDLVIEPPSKAHPFAEWLWNENIALALPMVLGQWLNMRYSEVFEAHVDLSSGSLDVDWKRRRATILGKGSEGKTRYIDFDDLVGDKLKEYLKWRKALKHCDTDALAVIRDSRARVQSDTWIHIPQNAGDHNKKLKEAGEIYNTLVEKEGRADLVLDLELVSSHKIGRHVFGTFFAENPEVSEKMLMKMMGITSHAVVEKYINFSDDQVRRAYSSATATYLNGSGAPQKEGNELVDLLSKIPAEKQDAVKELLKALVS